MNELQDGFGRILFDDAVEKTVKEQESGVQFGEWVQEIIDCLVQFAGRVWSMKGAGCLFSHEH